MTRTARAGIALLAALSSGSTAFATTWKVGRAASDCDGTSDFYDLINGSDPGCGIVVALESPSVVSGDTARVWPGTSQFGVSGYPCRVTMKSGVVLLAVDDGSGDPVVVAGTAGQVPAFQLNGCSAQTEIVGFENAWDSSSFGSGGGVAAYVSSGASSRTTRSSGRWRRRARTEPSCTARRRTSCSGRT